jgi:hypothetical protein
MVYLFNVRFQICYCQQHSQIIFLVDKLVSIRFNFKSAGETTSGITSPLISDFSIVLIANARLVATYQSSKTL